MEGAEDDISKLYYTFWIHKHITYTLFDASIHFRLAGDWKWGQMPTGVEPECYSTQSK